MTTSKTTTKLLTADDLLRLYSEGIGGELIRGVLVEKVSVSLLHGEIAMLLGSILISFIRPRGLGRIAGSDAGMMLERGPDTVREPDIAYISAEKLPLGVNIQGFYQGAPDLVVEIRSPSDSLTAVNDKAQMWLRFGVGLVWVVFPDSRTVEAHPASGPPVLLGEDDNLDGGDVLPGFTCAVKDIFPR